MGLFFIEFEIPLWCLGFMTVGCRLLDKEDYVYAAVLTVRFNISGREGQKRELIKKTRKSKNNFVVVVFYLVGLLSGAKSIDCGIIKAADSYLDNYYKMIYRSPKERKQYKTMTTCSLDFSFIFYDPSPPASFTYFGELYGQRAV